MLNVAADSGGDAVELALQPLFERRRPVVLEDADIGEYLRPRRVAGKYSDSTPMGMPASWAMQAMARGAKATRPGDWYMRLSSVQYSLCH